MTITEHTDVTGSALLILVSRLTLGLWLLSSALGKFRSLSDFQQGALEYQLLPEPITRLLALILPWCELLLSLSLLLSIMLPLVGLAVVSLLICFIFAVAINLRRGRTIPCNCHGIGTTNTISQGTVARNGVLILWCLPLILFAPYTIGTTAWRDIQKLLHGPIDIALIILLTIFALIVPLLVEWSLSLNSRVSRRKLRV